MRARQKNGSDAVIMLEKHALAPLVRRFAAISSNTASGLPTIHESS